MYFEFEKGSLQQHSKTAYASVKIQTGIEPASLDFRPTALTSKDTNAMLISSLLVAYKPNDVLMLWYRKLPYSNIFFANKIVRR